MQFIVVRKRDGEWLAGGLMNARRLTMDQQFFLDELESLPAEAQRRVSDPATSLKTYHP
jgi:hypothetical protein